ncbi:MAG: glycosyltransferase [Actinomycetota bacterium]
MSERPIVIQVVNGFERAGAERVAVDLATHLDDRLWDSRMATVRDGELHSEVEAAGIPHYITGGGFDLSVPAVLYRLYRHFAIVRPTVVHTHMIGSDVVGRLAAMAARVPVIVSTQHDVYERPWLISFYRRLTSRMIHATVACSYAVEDFCLDDLGVPPDRLFQIHNGIDVERFASSRTPWREPPVFGAVGNLLAVKGHRYLIKALALVRESHPDVRVLIAGEGPERANLEQLAEDLGISDAVELRGSVADVPTFLKEIDVLVHPSLQEGLAMGVIEAMAAAKPVIASAVTALPRLLGEGRYGRLVTPAQPHALAEAMSAVIEDKDDAIRTGEVAAERVAAEYSLHRAVGHYSQLYRRLMVSRGLDHPIEPLTQERSDR